MEPKKEENIDHDNEEKMDIDMEKMTAPVKTVQVTNKLNKFIISNLILN